MFVAVVAVAGCKSWSGDERSEAMLELKTENYILNHEAQEIELYFETNRAYEIDIKGDWVELIESRATESYTLRLAVAYNDSPKSRTTGVTITAEDKRANLVITQQGRGKKMVVAVKHGEEVFYSPLWYGEQISGSVVWGDGSEERYVDGISHNYGTSAEHELSFEMFGVEGFEIERIGKIDTIDIFVE